MSVTEASNHARDLLKSTLSLGSVLAMLASIFGAVSCLAVGVWEGKDTLDKIYADIADTKRDVTETKDAQTDMNHKLDDHATQIAGVKDQVSDLSMQMHDAKSDMARVQKRLDKIQPSD